VEQLQRSLDTVPASHQASLAPDMERVSLPTFKLADASAKEISVKMDKVFGDELKSTVYQLSGGPKGGAPKSIFKTSEKLPFRPVERNRLALTMSTEDVMNTNQYYEDETQKGQRRWKEIRHLFLVTRKTEHSRGSLENALWYFGNNGITCNHFVHAIMDEFGFSPEVDDMEKHLRWLYWSFSGGTADKADWREILATFRVVIFFRMVRVTCHLSRVTCHVSPVTCLCVSLLIARAYSHPINTNTRPTPTPTPTGAGQAS